MFPVCLLRFAIMGVPRMIFQTIFIILTLWHSSQANLGYFWQITDLHLDLNYSATNSRDKMCWRQNGLSYRSEEGRFGAYGCDSPLLLVESAIRAMKKVTGNEMEFILWTGGTISQLSGDDNLGEDATFSVIQNVTSLLKREFPLSNIYPVLGSMEWQPKNKVVPDHHKFHKRLQRYGQLWAKWVPPEAMETFNKGGYYAIEEKNRRVKLLILNTSVYFRRNALVGQNEEDPLGQFAWLKSMLVKADRMGDMVYIIGHTPPGKMERYMSSRFGWYTYLEQFNKRYTYSMHETSHYYSYINLVRDYHRVIAGQFFGHFHSDSFRVFYDKKDKWHYWNRVPLSYLFIAPSVSPREPAIADEIGPNNPGVRLYKYDMTTGQVKDYAQYYLNLTAANQKGYADWRVLYNFTQFYDLRNVSAASLSDLALAFYKDSEATLFSKYYMANTVGYEDPNLKPCSNLCRRTHFCVITNVDYQEYERCIQTAFGSTVRIQADGMLSMWMISSLLWSLFFFSFNTMLTLSQTIPFGSYS